MCMSGGSPAPAPAQTPAPAPVALPATQHNPAATPNGQSAADPSRPKVGGRRAAENAKYADKSNPNLRRSDTGGITM